MSKTRGSMILKKLHALKSASLLPTVTLEVGATLYRVQGSQYTQHFHFYKPTDPANMGRYDSLSHGTCYLAEKPEVAMAETFLQNVYGGQSIWTRSDIDKRCVAEVEVSIPLTLLDIGALMPHIGVKLDELTGVDRELNQAISQFVADSSELGMHGLKYPGRHLLNGECIALFDPPCSAGALKGVSLTPVSHFKCPYSGLDGEDLLYKKLGITVINDR